MPPTCTVALWADRSIVSQRKQKATPSPSPVISLSPQPALENIWRPQKWEYPLMFILAGSFSFLLLFLNNQSSRKCGELTAWQQQRNSLEKLRWILLRFQALRQDSQRSNRLLVVFNHFFCGTFLVPETNLSVRHEGAWEHRLSGWKLWFGDYYTHINYLLTSLWQDGTCPVWGRAEDRAVSLLLFKVLPCFNLF